MLVPWEKVKNRSSAFQRSVTRPETGRSAKEGGPQRALGLVKGKGDVGLLWSAAQPRE